MWLIQLDHVTYVLFIHILSICVTFCCCFVAIPSCIILLFTCHNQNLHLVPLNTIFSIFFSFPPMTKIAAVKGFHWVLRVNAIPVSHNQCLRLLIDSGRSQHICKDQMLFSVRHSEMDLQLVDLWASLNTKCNFHTHFGLYHTGIMLTLEVSCGTQLHYLIHSIKMRHFCARPQKQRYGWKYLRG